jgi:RNA polymerase subunit RPABC4/transcription elongation factor Spt4
MGMAQVIMENICHHCGEGLDFRWKFCPECGTSVSSASTGDIVVIDLTEKTAKTPEPKTRRQVRKDKEDGEPLSTEWWDGWLWQLVQGQNTCFKPKPEAVVRPSQPPQEAGLEANPVRAPP